MLSSISSQFEPTAPHKTYVALTIFLIVYALFSQYIRNHLHLSEPPLAVLYGFVLGPHGLRILTPRDWSIGDEHIMKFTRLVAGIQCFAIGIELPKHYFKRHWKSVLYLLGPVMTFSWSITAFFAYFIFQTSVPTALIIAACLTPTDPVLAASVLSHSRFSGRVPRRLRHLLAAESACNDGVSFPFLYIGLVIYTTSSPGDAIKEWIIYTLLWQCTLGLSFGILIGLTANRLLRFSDNNDYIARPSFVVFYLLFAILSVGVGSITGTDDFLVAFGAGIGFAQDGWFSKKIRSAPFPTIVDLVLNSSMFIIFGSIIPWSDFTPKPYTPACGIWQLFLFLILVLLFRRIPILLLLKRFIPDIRTYREALFCGHFGPMGVGALFLSLESRGQLEHDSSLPSPKPELPVPPYDGIGEREKAVWLVWPVVCFVVLGSTIVHGLSVLGISLGGHFSRRREDRAGMVGGETEGLSGMV